jgi:hypothetical protein
MMRGTEPNSYRPTGRLNGRAPTGMDRAVPRRTRAGGALVVPRALAAALALAGLVAFSALAAHGRPAPKVVAFSALAAHSHPAPKVAVVMDASVANDPALRAEAEAWLRRSAPPGAARIAARVPAGATQQLSVTSTLATRGYDTIVAVGLDSHVALEPVVRRYPDLRVVRWPGAH